VAESRCAAGITGSGSELTGPPPVTTGMTSSLPMADSLHDLPPQLANNRAYWLGWGSTDDVHADLPIYRTDLRNGMLNGVLRARNVDIDDAVRRARTALDGTSWLWWYNPGDSDSDVADQLVDRGAVQAAAVPIMAARLRDKPVVPQPPGLRIELARTPEALAAFASVYPIPNGMTEADVAATTAVELARESRHELQLRYVAWLAEVPVACGALSISNGVAGIYNMATVAAYESRGIATALAAELLGEAHERGLKIATLTASARGAHIYRRLGFEDVSEYRLYQL